jgi:hypothetical protein
VRAYLKKKKNPSQKRAGGLVQGVNPDLKPQYHKKKVGGGLLLAVKVKVKLQQDTGLKGHLIYKVLHAC